MPSISPFTRPLNTCLRADLTRLANHFDLKDSGNVHALRNRLKTYLNANADSLASNMSFSALFSSRDRKRQSCSLLDYSTSPVAVQTASPPNLEEPGSTMTTFNTGHTSGTVNNVNRDFIVHGDLTYTINCIVEGPAPDMRQLLEVLPKISTTPTVARSLGAEGHPTVCGPITAQMAATYVTINNFEATSAKDSSIEIRVIAEMMDMLLENPSLHHSDTLPETLASLRRMLMLAELALRAYRQTPLAQTLNSAIIAEAERCHQLLKDLFTRLSDYRHTLPAVLFQFIRRYVWSTAGEGLEFSELNSKLGQCHSSLAACILALGSAAWPELERGQGGKTALAEFYSSFAQESASLRHIQIDTVIVIDHLGRNLPVPTIFCNSWQDFHAVIVGHCASFAGDLLVQRGDYRILKQDNDQVIAPAELSGTIRPGMTVEMSIVLREQTPKEYGGAEHKCPRCSHMNRKVITASGWVSCQRCCANFQVLSHTRYGDGDEQELVSPEALQLEPDTIRNEQCFFRRICILLTDTETIGTPPRTLPNGADWVPALAAWPESILPVAEDGDDMLYCFCDGTTYGEMIACDETDCEREWFHLACLGLTVPPEGAWFCEECKVKRAAKRGNRGSKRRAAGSGVTVVNGA